MKKDRISNEAVENPIKANNYNTTTTGDTIDLRGYYDGCQIIASVGASVPTFTATEAWQFQIQEHAQGAGWSAAADADVIGADADGTATGTFAIINSTGESNAAYECQYIGKAAYIRPRMLLVTAAGASHSGSSVLCMTAQKLGYKYPPVT